MHRPQDPYTHETKKKSRQMEPIFCASAWGGWRAHLRRGRVHHATHADGGGSGGRRRAEGALPRARQPSVRSGRGSSGAQKREHAARDGLSWWQAAGRGARAPAPRARPSRHSCRRRRVRWPAAGRASPAASAAAVSTLRVRQKWRAKTRRARSKASCGHRRWGGWRAHLRSGRFHHATHADGGGSGGRRRADRALPRARQPSVRSG